MEKGPIQDSDLLNEFIIDLCSREDHYVVYKVLNHRLLHGISMDEKITFIRDILRERNPYWEPLSFFYDVESEILTIDMKNLIRIGYSFYNGSKKTRSIHNIFSYLPLKRVVFKNLKRYDDMTLYVIKSPQLDLSHASNAPLSLKNAMRFKHATEFVLSPKNAKELNSQDLRTEIHVLSAGE